MNPEFKCRQAFASGDILGTAWKPLVIVIWILALSSGHMLHATEKSEVIEKIRNDWLKRRSETRTFHYDVAGRRLFPKGTVVGKDDPDAPPGMPAQPETDFYCGEKISWSWDLDAQAFLRQHEGKCFSIPAWRFVPHQTIHLLRDGTVKFLSARSLDPARPNERDETLIVYGPDGDPLIADPTDYPMLFAHGLLLPDGWKPQDDKVLSSASSMVLKEEGKGQQRGRDCVIVKATRREPANKRLREQMWVDTARNSSIVVWERYFDDRLIARFEADYQEVDFGWVPLSWTVDIYNGPPDKRKVTAHQSAKVTYVSINRPIPKTRFELGGKQDKLAIDERDGELLDARHLVSIVEPGSK